MPGARGPLRQRILQKLINVYPPYLGAGIRARRGRDDQEIVVRMKLTFYNRNLFGTHFGGSLYAMCDPFFLFLLVRRLGSEYVCWDKAAAIEFRKPGRGIVTATFRVEPQEIERIRAEVERDGKTEPVFAVDVVDEAGETVARVTKRLWVRRKENRRP